MRRVCTIANEDACDEDYRWPRGNVRAVCCSCAQGRQASNPRRKSCFCTLAKSSRRLSGRLSTNAIMIDTCSGGIARIPISPQLTTLGTYAVQVAANRQPLKNSVSITCADFNGRVRFSLKDCNSNIEVANRRRRAVLTDDTLSVSGPLKQRF